MPVIELVLVNFNHSGYLHLPWGKGTHSPLLLGTLQIPWDAVEAMPVPLHGQIVLVGLGSLYPKNLLSHLGQGLIALIRMPGGEKKDLISIFSTIETVEVSSSG